MSAEELENVAIKADFIVNGYAFTKTSGGNYRVLNLNNKGKTAALLNQEVLLWRVPSYALRMNFSMASATAPALLSASQT